MAATLDQVVRDARSLSMEQREELIAELIRDLDGEPSGSLDEIDASWKKEIERRIEEIDSGKVKCIPAEEVFERLRPRSDETI